jgi:pimeloyl-ACP methyl ester carboxylesterase
MVHGFPESWYSWRYQLDAFAEAGYHAAAINVRGYGRSSAPSGIEEYRMTKHVADKPGVVEALGEKSAIIVGHDWGRTDRGELRTVAPRRVPRAGSP